MTLAVIDDLMFRSKLEAALGGRITVVSSLEALRAQIGRPDWTRAVVDLQLASGVSMDIVRAIRTQQPALPVIAYGSHVDVERLEQARAAGCAEVLARSELVQRLAQWSRE